MSRIGKKPITLPAGVTAQVTGTELTVKGPKGTLTTRLHPHIRVAVEGTTLTVTTAHEDDTKGRALWGTFGSIITSMVKGVDQGFAKQLEINGVGYKATMKGTDLGLEVGFTHPVTIKPPAGIEFKVEKNTITVAGADKQLVGQVAAEVRAVRKPEPYKGKGIKYADEVIIRKAGKTAAKAAA